MQVLAIDVGGTHLKSALVAPSGGFTDFQKEPTIWDEGPKALLDQLADRITTYRTRQPDLPIGIGIPGMVDPSRRRVSHPPNFPGWATIDVVDELHQRLPDPPDIVLDNDANVAALGSHRFGRGRDFHDFILLTLGTGVGGGIILNDQLYRGSHGMAGEIGHMIIQAEGARSNAATQGTLEAYLGQRFLSRRAEEVLQKHPESSLHHILQQEGQELQPHHISKAAREGDQVARRIFSEAGKFLGYALINLVHLFDVRTFLFSGGVAHAGDLLLDPARVILQQQLMPPFRSDIQLLVEQEPENLGLRGAAALAFQQLEGGSKTV
jgi:glucokinase